MVKKAKTTKAKKATREFVPVKTQLLIAASIAVLLVCFGFVVAWLDSNSGYSIKRTNARYEGVTIKGESVCLPLEKSHTTECVMGIKTSSGTYYKIQGNVDRDDSENTIEATGTLMPLRDRQVHDVAGVLIVD